MDKTLPAPEEGAMMAIDGAGGGDAAVAADFEVTAMNLLMIMVALPVMKL